MKGNDDIIAALNNALTIELTAINQYFIQAKMCQDWGYAALGAKHRAESIGEMKHAEVLIDRILFLDGTPNIRRYNPVKIGDDVPKQLRNDLELETAGVAAYNDLVHLAASVKDGGTRELASRILVESEGHVDWLETQLALIESLGLPNYLQSQI